MKAILPRGMQGSGKSTWAKKFCAKHPDWVIISRDALRHMRGTYWQPKREGLITAWEESLIKDALDRKYHVIIDEMNLNPKGVASMKKYLKSLGVTDIKIKDFTDVPLKTCIERDKQRPFSIGEKVLRDTYDRYLAPKFEPTKQDKTLPSAIICDLDGTLCLHNGRSPFQYDKCDTDLVNEVVLDILKKCSVSSGNFKRVIFLSGREDVCKDKTIAWLKNVIDSTTTNYELHMRKAGDTRKDSIVKNEMFEAVVKDKYYVDFVLDDRNQVVDMWRSLGLTCLQVAPGDF